MKVIGLTGGIGAGKTQILNYLNDKYGASICQADEVAKKLQKKGKIIIIISHDYELLSEVCTKIIYYNQGGFVKMT